MGALRPTSLTVTQDIRRFFQQARRIIHHKAIDIKVAPASEKHGRFILSVPKKMGSAPQRNLLKRRLRALFYEQRLGEYGYDWGFFAKPAAAELSFQELQAVVLSVCPLLAEQ